MTGREVRRLRKRLRLTQGQFAARVGVHRVTVAQWERGAQRIAEPTARLIRLLAKTTGPKARRKARRET